MAMINGKLRTKFVEWITREPPPTEVPPCDYTRLKQEIRPGDVLLIEGRSRVSNIIRSITQSPWTHAALYVGRMDDIENDEIRSLFEKFKPADDSKRYIVEGLLGQRHGDYAIESLSPSSYTHMPPNWFIYCRF